MEKKSIVKNSLFNIIYKGFTALFPVLTMTYISRTLLPERVGLVSYANTIVIYFTTIASLGIPNYGIKEISKGGDNIEERSKTFFELFSINALSTLICTLLYFVLINFAPYFENKRTILNTMGLLLVFNLCNVDWFYQGIEEYKIISVRSIIVKIASFIAMLLFVKSPDDYLIYALILCFATAGNNLYNMAIISRYIDFKKYNLQLRRHLMPVLILLASTIATEIYTALDTVMLEHYHGSSTVAFYTNAVKIVRTVYTLVIAMIAPLYPRISFYLQKGEKEKSNKLLNKAFRIIVIIGVPSVIGLCSMADQIVLILFGKEYARSISVLKIASILVFVFSIAYLLGHIVLMASGNEKNILKATIVGAVVNTVINFSFIPALKENGAILASIISEITVTSILVFYGRKYFSLSHDFKFYLTVGIASGIMTVVIIIARTYMIEVMPRIVSFFLIVAFAILTYILILALLKNEIIVEIKNKIMSKI